jgi:uncharacterized phiE125 gp8 family phage protein
MHRPVLIVPPAALPVSLEEAKQHVLVEADEDASLLEALIGAATEHLDGWTGVLGRCLVEQEWRQDFDCFARCLPLPIGPVLEITSIRYRNAAGQMATVSQADYSLRTDGGGRASVRFRDQYAFPGSLSQVGALSVSFRAGYAVDDVPKPLKTAITMLAAQWFNNREATVTGTIATELPLAVSVLISPYRKMRI